MSISQRIETGNKYFSSFQHSMLNSISYTGLSRFFIKRSKSSIYTIHHTTSIPRNCFYFLTGNTIIKVFYIIYLTIWKSAEMEFLDKIALALYFLLFGIMGMSLLIFWLRKYPLYGTIIVRFCQIGKNMLHNLKFITANFSKLF